MREIACFTVLIYGSLQLGSLIYCTLSVKLHSKITYKLNGNHKKAPKWCFNSWLLDWALCLVELAAGWLLGGWLLAGWLAGWPAGWLAMFAEQTENSEP